jgi:hypothetical protein
MGTVLEMISRMTLSTFLAAGLLLTNCGSDKTPDPAFSLLGSVVKKVTTPKSKEAAPRPATTRASLAKFKTPMIMAEIPQKGFFTFVVPYGKNGDVDTWASVDDKTISFRQGMVVATRGFGPDIMQSSGPSILQIASGAGSYPRNYYYLDGADQTQQRKYTCTLSNLGTDTITVVERQHTTRHVIETCTGESGNFSNEYWFENGTFLRKSKQLLTLEWGDLVLSRVIDNG